MNVLFWCLGWIFPRQILKVNSKSGVQLVLTLELIKISLMHVQQQEGDKKVIDYDDLDNSKAVRNIWGQWGLIPNYSRQMHRLRTQDG